MSNKSDVFTCFSCHYQSESLVVCEVDEDLVKKLKEFRFRKETNNAAIVSECSHFTSFNLFCSPVIDRVLWVVQGWWCKESRVQVESSIQDSKDSCFLKCQSIHWSACLFLKLFHVWLGLKTFQQMIVMYFFFCRMMKINHKNIQCRPSSVYIWRTEELLPHAAGGVTVVEWVWSFILHYLWIKMSLLLNWI